MSRPIEQILLSLMPTQGLPLPSSLVDLASSLVAHSKIKASTLKADEEIARSYACAHIAADRLKTSLDLPPIDVRPPIAPRTYKRLYAYLDKSVPGSAPTAGSTPKTPKTPRRFRDADAAGSPLGSRGRLLPSRGTPGKEQASSLFRTPSKRAAGNDDGDDDDDTPTKPTGARRAAREEVARPLADFDRSLGSVYPWIQPTIRFMCNETEVRVLAPTVLAGVEYIISLGGGGGGGRGSSTADPVALGNLPGLVAVVYFYSAAKLGQLETDEEASKAHDQRRREALDLLARARREATVRRSGTGGAEERDRAWRGFSAVPSLREFDEIAKELSARGWLDQDWYGAIADVARARGGGGTGPGSKSRGQRADEGEEEEEGSGRNGSGRILRIHRADTMFQDRYDYLGKERLAEYHFWKTDVLEKVEQLERERAGRMDTDGEGA